MKTWKGIGLGLLGLLMCCQAPGSATPRNANAELIISENTSAMRIHVFFSGKVQGVGFRQTTKDYAQQLGLSGWVRNLDDSRVEMVAEGPESDLKTLLSRLKLKFEIDKTELEHEEPTGKEKGFKVAR